MRTTCLCGRIETHALEDCSAAKALLTEAQWNDLRRFVNAQLVVFEDQGDSSELVGFTFGMTHVVDPFSTLDMFEEVNPLHEYGQDFVESAFIGVAKALEFINQ